MPSYRITTLGCRVNHAEAREIESLLVTRGLVRAAAGQPADVHIVHTCTVTSTAAAKSRHAIRRAVRAGGPPKVFVTGCYAATDPVEAGRLVRRRDQVISHAEQFPTGRQVGFPGSSSGLSEPSDGSLERSFTDRLAERLDHWLAESQPPADRAAERDRSQIRIDRPGCSDQEPRSAALAAPRRAAAPNVVPLPLLLPRTAARHVRAELKIQDGCDAHCTFCVIPRTRPQLRSKRVADVVAEARRLVDLGHAEIVLTGIFIGAYGHETALRRRQANPSHEPLAELIDAVAAVPGIRRLRISSMEPGDVTEPLLDAMVANAPVVVPHLHLPLQSGSDAVLRRMNRQYRVGDYLEMIDTVNAVLTRDGLPPAITTDVMCGFPGETAADFEETIGVARDVGYLHMHVFPYSARAGTAAARWTDNHVPAPEIRRRVRRLIDLEEDPRDGLGIAGRRRLLGRVVRVILEQPDRVESDIMIGRCDHYTAVRVRTCLSRGRLIRVRITEVGPTWTDGVVETDPVSLPILS